MSEQATVQVAQDVTGTSNWMKGQTQKLLLHIHVDAVGGAPSADVEVQGVNIRESDANDTAVTPKQISTTTVTATGDTYVEIDTFPYNTVRINVTANTDVKLEAVLTRLPTS